MESAKSEKWVKVGEVSVDSGCLLLADPAYVQEVGRDLPPYGEMVGLESSSRVHGTLMSRYHSTTSPYRDSLSETANVLQIFSGKSCDSTYGEYQPQAVVTSTGIGDGMYSVYAKIDEEQNIAEIKVVFLGDEGEYASIAGDFMTATPKEIEQETETQGSRPR